MGCVGLGAALTAVIGLRGLLAVFTDLKNVLEVNYWKTELIALPRRESLYPKYCTMSKPLALGEEAVVELCVYRGRSRHQRCLLLVLELTSLCISVLP